MVWTISWHQKSAYILCLFHVWTLSAGDEIKRSYAVSNDGGNNQLSDERLCLPGTLCTTINNCLLVRDLMDKTCLATEKLREFTCGYSGTQPMVCCPKGGEFSPVPTDYSNSGLFRPPQHGQSTYNTPNSYQNQNDRNIYYNPNKANKPGSNTTPRPYNKDKPDGTATSVNINCGQSLVREVADNKLGVHPWVAKVGFLNTKTRNTNYVCLGAIISPRVVLTSAYCANASTKVNLLFSVRVGEYDDKTDPDCNSAFCANPVQKYRIDHALLHPGYDQATYKHNVALIILNNTIQYNLAAQPVCVLQNGQVPLVGRRGLLVGWGKTTNALGQEISPTQQQQLEVPIIPLDKCIETFQEKVPVTDEHLCVGGEGMTDACTGFTGGPLVLLEHHTFSRYYLVGIVSFGSDRCGKDGTPNVYTNIHNYAEWITDNME